MSGINIKFKNIFIHVPKCAGGSMASLEFVSGVGHKTLAMISKDKQFNNNFFKWAFVRNPYERIESTYFWILHRHRSMYNSINKENNLTKDKAGYEYFLDHLEEMLPEQYDPFIKYKIFSWHIYPMFYFLEHPSYKMDYIGKMETLQKDWRYIINRIEDLSKLKIKNKTLSGSKDKINRPKNIKLSEHYKKIIEKVYQKDFELFSY